MFTTGSKLFLGGTVLSFAGALAFGLSTGGPTGLLGTIGLVSVGIVFAFLAGINIYARDCNVPPMDEAAVAQSAASRGPAGRRIRHGCGSSRLRRCRGGSSSRTSGCS